MFEEYTDTVIDHFMCPRNAGSMPDADAEATAGDPSCGDSLTLYLKVKDDVIERVSYLVFGCAAAIAAGSMTSELILGKTLSEALEVTDTDIANALGGLPDHKLHCSVLGASAVKKTIEAYREKKAAS